MKRKKNDNLGGIMGGVRIVEVIAATNATIGKGIEDDPVRGVLQLYSIEGELILEIDPAIGVRDASLRRYYPENLGV